MTLTMTCLARYRRHPSGLTEGRNMWESTEAPCNPDLVRGNAVHPSFEQLEPIQIVPFPRYHE